MADATAYNENLADDMTEFQFESKQWTIINDAQNGASYPNGIITFDLTSVANTELWTNISEGVLSIPLVLVVTSGAGTEGFTADLSNDYVASLKGGYWQLIHSMSVMINGQTYQNAVPFSNMDINYRILSQFSTNDLQTYGDSIGLPALESPYFQYCPGTGAGNPTFYMPGIGECNNVIMQASMSASGGYQGVTAASANLPTTNQFNSGRWKRMQNTSYDPLGATNSYLKLLKNNTIANTELKNYVLQSNTTNEIVYYINATLPLRLISNLLANMPLQKGAKISLNIQTNASSYVNFSSNTGGKSFLNTGYSQQTWGTLPFQISPMFTQGSAIATATGFSSTTAAVAYTASLGICKSFAGSVLPISSYSHFQTACHIEVPMYKMSPEYEQKLINKAPIKNVIFNDIFNGINYNVPSLQPFNYTLPVMVTKPRYLLIYPFIASTVNGAGTPNASPLVLGNGTLIGSPVVSPFTSAPHTCTPYLQISNFNVLIAGAPLYSAPSNYNWEKFQYENRQLSINGGLVNGLSSGLISEADYTSGGYNMIYVDLSRHSWASDGVSRTISVTGTNNNLVPIDLYCFVGYEKSFEMSVFNGTIKG